MEIELINNVAKKQYEFHIEGKTARIEYMKIKDTILYLTHTEVPRELEGRGIGSSIIKAALEDIKKNNWTLAPLCPFVAKYVSKHPKWKSILHPGFNIS